MLQSPYTIADFAQGIALRDGSIRGNSVFAISGQKRRKRAEVVLSIDGHGISICSISKTRLETSYSIAPSAVMTCAPCSIRYPRSEGRNSARYTYCSILDGSQRLCLFVEQVANGKSYATITPKIVEISSTSSIVHIESIPCSESDAQAEGKQNLLVVHEDGNLQCFSPDLEKSVWSRTPPTMLGSARTKKIAFVTLLDVEDSRSGFLNNRDDIIYHEDSDRTDDIGYFLLVVACDESKLYISLFKIPTSSPDKSFESTVCQLLSLELPSACGLGCTSRFTFHVQSGSLFQTSGESIAIHDISNPLPQPPVILSELSGSSSCLAISSSRIAVARNGLVKLIDVKYRSLLAGQDIKPLFRKAMEGTHPDYDGLSMQLITYLPRSAVLVVLCQRKLLAVPLASQQHKAGKRTHDDSLLTSLGRALPQPEQGHSRNLLASVKPVLTPEFANSIKKQDSALFEECVSREFQVHPKAPHNLTREQLSFILSAIFAPVKVENTGSNSATYGLQLVFWPSRIGPALLQLGLLNPHELEAAFHNTGTMPILAKLKPGSLLYALSTLEDLGELAVNYLGASNPLESVELVYNLIFLMRSSHTSPEPDQLHSAEIASSPDQAMTLHTIDSQSTKPFKQALYLALQRLRSFPTSRLASLLKDALTRAQLHTLVNLLRLEIAQNGWLAPYDVDASTILSTVTSSQDRSLDLISHILCSTIDALGLSGWIVGTSTLAQAEETDTANTMLYMKAEVSAALEAVEEAVYLKGMLGSILLHGQSARTTPGTASPTKTKTKPRSKHQTLPISINMNGGASEENMLPLGLRSEAGISKTRIADGGEIVRRTHRDISRLKSRLVPKYSIERIVL